MPVIALASSDCDIRQIDYPIIANDSAKASVEFFVAALEEAYKEGKTIAQTVAKQKLEEVKS
mgnify:FL=1